MAREIGPDDAGMKRVRRYRSASQPRGQADRKQDIRQLRLGIGSHRTITLFAREVVELDTLFGRESVAFRRHQRDAALGRGLNAFEQAPYREEMPEMVSGELLLD